MVKKPAKPQAAQGRRATSAKSKGADEARKRWLVIASAAAGVVCIGVIIVAIVFRSSSEPAEAAANNTENEDKNSTPVATVPVKLTPAQVAEKKKTQRETAVKQFHGTVAPFFKKYCYDCHGPETQEEGLAFHKLKDEKTIFADRKQWEKVLRVVKSSAMPPADHDPKPGMKERNAVVAWIDSAIFKVDCQLVDDPGRVTIRRLNRAEYNNTIRDLLGVDFKPAKDFPSDDVGYGFDNIGDVLSLPPLLMEKYILAAEQIAAKAIVPEDPKGKTQRQQAKKMRHQGGGSGPVGNGYVGMFSNGELYGSFNFPRTGEYRIRIDAMADQAGKELAKIELKLDNKEVGVVSVQGRRQAKEYTVKLRVQQGRHKVAAAFTNDFYNAKLPRGRRDRNVAIKYVEIEGPLNQRLSDPSAVQKRIIVAVPGPKKSVKQAATEVVARFLPRAFRRPVADDEIAKYVQLVELVTKKGDSYEQGIQIALTGILVSPHFLFRIEQDRKPNESSAMRNLNDYELANRLSYFLWSSMPDAELFDLAKQGKLHQPDLLDKQVRRMLKDDKSQALVKNFGVQWLNLRILGEVTPDKKRFPWSEPLRKDMAKETELFFAAVMKEDRSILDFLDGRFTHVNERLAKHYGIPGVKGDKFRRISLTDDKRAGVLTHASILTLTSNATRTSPVMRGKWILENIFDQAPPDPPPNVPELDEEKIAAGNLSLRKQLEIHRKNAVCASCHVTMDALGFGFENFDPVGRWREKVGKNPVDSSGELPDGSKFRGPLQLVKILKTRKDDFARCFSKKMLTFALGRGLEYYDKCAVDEITKAVAKNEYRFSTVVLEVVRSDPFLKRRGEGKQ